MVSIFSLFFLYIYEYMTAIARECKLLIYKYWLYNCNIYTQANLGNMGINSGSQKYVNIKKIIFQVDANRHFFLLLRFEKKCSQLRETVNKHLFQNRLYDCNFNTQANLCDKTVGGKSILIKNISSRRHPLFFPLFLKDLGDIFSEFRYLIL